MDKLLRYEPYGKAVPTPKIRTKTDPPKLSFMLVIEFCGDWRPFMFLLKCKYS